jgi:hypothetical protein
MRGALYDDPSAFYDSDIYYDAPLGKVQMAKSKIAKNSSKLNAAQLVPKIQVSLTAVADNATTFTGAATLLTTGNTVVTDLTDADVLVASLEVQLAQAREVRDMKRGVALDFYDELVRYVDNIAKGDASIILLAAMDVALPPGPPPPMTKVEGLTFVPGGNEQTGEADWKTVSGARFYDVETSTNPNDSTLWKAYDSSSVIGLKLTDLTSGQKLWVRVRAVNSVEKGPWSDPACAMIP